MEKEHGFTLVELMFVMALMSILMVMGVFAARQFWFQRSLTGGQDAVAVQLRALQTRTAAEGITTRYYGAWFTSDTSEARDTWGTVRFEAGASPTTCTSTGAFQFDAGVIVTQVNFANTGTGGIPVSGIGTGASMTAIERCRALSSVPNNADLVFFFSRGTATEGNSANTDCSGCLNLVLTQPRLNNRTEEIRVLGLTGRVEKL